MADRLRLSQTHAPPVSPAFQSYSHTSTAVRRMLARADGSTLTTNAHAPDGADHLVAGDVLLVQLVSAPLAAGNVFTSGDGWDMCVQMLEAHASNNLFLQVFIGIVSKDGSTARATIRSKTAHGSEMNTSLRSLYLSGTLSGSYTTVVGDRIVIEISATGTPTGSGGTQGHNCSLRLGNTGSGDLAENDTQTGTTLNPWFEFPNNLLFMGQNNDATLDTLIEDVWTATPRIQGTGDKDRTLTFRHLMNMMSTYTLTEAPGTRWDYNDLGVGLLGNAFKYMLGHGPGDAGRTDLIDSSTLINDYFATAFADLDFEDSPNWNKRGNRGMGLSLRDLNRMGWLVLNRGNWNGTRVVHPNWFGGFGIEGVFYGNIQVAGSVARTSGSADAAGNYLNSPADSLTTFGGGVDQNAIGPGVYGLGWWQNGIRADTDPDERMWSTCPLDMLVGIGHDHQENLVILPTQEIVITFNRSTEWGTWPDQDPFNDAIAALVAGITGAPNYASSFPGSTWTTASDGDAGIGTSALDTFLTNVDSAHISRRGRQVRTKSTIDDNGVDWASTSKPILILTMLTAMQAPVQLPGTRVVINQAVNRAALY